MVSARTLPVLSDSARSSYTNETFSSGAIALVRRDFVAKAILLDPVALLLAQPDVAYNFLYRPARPKKVRAKALGFGM